MKRLHYFTLIMLTMICSSQAADNGTITFVSGDQEFNLPESVARRFMGQWIEAKRRVGVEPNVIRLTDSIEPDTLEFLVNMMRQADAILVDQPVGREGSYRKLAESEIFNNLDLSELLTVLVELDFLGIDERIQDAVSLRIAQLLIDDKNAKFQDVEDGLKKIIGTGVGGESEVDVVEKLVEQILLRVVGQSMFLLKRLHERDTMNYLNRLSGQKYYDRVPGPSIRELLIHDLAPQVRVVGYRLWFYLDEENIVDIDGYNDIPNIEKVVGVQLNDNQIRSIPKDLKLDKVQKLNLSHNKISSIPKDLKLDEVRILNLSNNQLKELPVLVMPKIEALFLSYNQLKTLPSMNYQNLKSLNIVYLDKVQMLDLSNNQISSIDKDLKLDELRALNLSRNKLEELPLLVMPKIEGLFLNYNQLKRLPNMNYQNLKGLNIAHNDLDVLPTMNLPSLRELDIRDNKLKTLPNLGAEDPVTIFWKGNELTAEVQDRFPKGSEFIPAF